MIAFTFTQDEFALLWLVGLGAIIWWLWAQVFPDWLEWLDRATGWWIER